MFGSVKMIVASMAMGLQGLLYILLKDDKCFLNHFISVDLEILCVCV